jgi:DNA-binding MarR family transcriptional regulator/GNAT superfamily N-acetyltransferase
MSIANEQIAAVRAFNRDYTRRIGVLSRSFLGSPWSLTEGRVLYEIAHRPGVTAAELARELGLDRGYLSRILKGFAARRLLTRSAVASDGRQRRLRLTAAGRREFAPLERGSQAQVRSMLAPLDASRRRAVLEAMSIIRDALAGPGRRAEVTLRAHRPGDMGWVVERHGALYFEEYGWNEEFEALVAGITAEFIDKLDPARERCWIADGGGRRLGCVFLVAEDARTARLRLLLVEPAARGLGLGRRLVGECVSFARAAGYRRIVLWTHANLRAARHLYERAGFKRTASEPRHSFGHDVVSESWELRLDGSAPATRCPAGAPER